MDEVFISYSRENRESAHALADALELHGLNVWWDRELIGGGDFAAEIERHLIAAQLVIVLWSGASVLSDFVRDESSRARDMRKLLPIRIDPIALPLGFGTLHTLDLLDWDGDPDDEAMTEVLSQVRHLLAQANDKTGEPLGRQRRNDSGDDPLSRRRWRRRSLIGVGLAAASGVGWWAFSDSRLRERQRAALSHLENAFTHHFKLPPDLNQAELEYRLATDNDSQLAEAYFYWAHLTVMRMEREQPPPSRAELLGLREDALMRFRMASALPQALGRGRLAVAEEQIALLDRTEPEPLARSSETARLAASAPPPADTGAATEIGQVAGTGAGAGSSSARATADGGSNVLSQPSLASQDSLRRRLPSPPAAMAPRPNRAQAAMTAAAAAPTPAVRQLPRLEATAEIQQAADVQAKALFSDDRDGRLSAQAQLANNPELAAMALPAALEAAKLSLRRTPAKDADRAGLSATLALLGGATSLTLQVSRSAIEDLQQQLSSQADRASAIDHAKLTAALARKTAIRPAVFLQIADARQAGVARQLAAELTAAGYATAEIENTGASRAPSRPEVRSHGGSDPALARWCRSRLSKLTGADAVLNNLRTVRPENDVFEIWFDAALCAPNGRMVAACSGRQG